MIELSSTKKKTQEQQCHTNMYAVAAAASNLSEVSFAWNKHIYLQLEDMGKNGMYYTCGKYITMR